MARRTRFERTQHLLKRTFRTEAMSQAFPFGGLVSCASTEALASPRKQLAMSR